LAAVTAASASAELTYEGNIGSSGEGAGQFGRVGSIAVNNATGDLYAIDAVGNRIEQFNEDGDFLRTWGYDVVQSGSDDKPLAHEVQRVTVRGDSGSFQLRFEGSTTSALPFNATAAEVEEAFNHLSSMENGSSTATVTGGPGDIGGSSPYTITFATGPRSTENVPQIELIGTNLGVPPGTQLSCTGKVPSFVIAPDSWTYQWLANGVPIPGATSPTYTLQAGDAGAAVQCQVTGKWFRSRISATNPAYQVVSPGASPAPPQLQSPIAAPAGVGVGVGGPGGEILTCFAGSWAGSPTSYTYRWFVNGAEVASTTTASTSNTYEIQEADLTERAVFQCSVAASNAGGASIGFSGLASTLPGPEPAPALPPEVLLSSPIASSVATTADGGAVLEVCQANPPSNDVCKRGVAGHGIGQLSFEGFSGPPEGIAVDESPLGAGAVYVVDSNNARVQKFTASGTPILEIGREVNKTTGDNLCTVASGDACGSAIPDSRTFDTGESTTYEPGTFGLWQAAFGIEELGDEIAVDKAGYVYVGDMRQGGASLQPRVQKFDAGGHFVGQTIIPTKIPKPGFYTQPVSVEVDAEQKVFTAVQGEDSSIDIFSPDLFTVEPSPTRFADRVAIDRENKPAQLAVDPQTQYIWTSDHNQSFSGATHVCKESGEPLRALLAFDDEGHQLECAVPNSEAAKLYEVTGLAISDSGLAYVGAGYQGVIKVFQLPVPEPPTVEEESVEQITTESARLHANVDPGFAATTYTFEYGPADCATSTCQTSTPGTVNGSTPVDASSIVVGLEPNTRYHYRVRLENRASGGPVYGPDRTFATYPTIDVLNDPCPNALARKQTKAASLQDCRAYELASAEFTGGYDVESDLVPGQAPFSLNGQVSSMVLYGVHDGGIPGAGNPTNRGLDPYVAVRDAAAKRWDTHYVGIPADNAFADGPFSSTLAEANSGLTTFAFAGDEICSSCFADGSSGIPVHLVDGSLVQGMRGSIPEPDAEPAGYVGRYLSSDGTKLVFGTTAKLEPAANENGDVTLYQRDLAAGATEVVSTMPDGSTIAGAEVGELDMSDDGSRVLLGKEISTDGAGNTYWHLYMHLAGSSHSSDVTPGATNGALFDGMTADGSKVFLTTTDQLLPGEDTDSSADIYEAEVESGGSVSLQLISVGAGGPSNDDTCGPNSWNTVSGDGHCGAVAIGGGGGVGEADGTVYFLSPELLDGSNGTANEPNLYVARPGAAPVFVATLEPGNPLVEHAVSESWVHHWSDFVTAPSGTFAAFASTEPLAPEYDNAGFAEVYRYEAGAGLECASCDPTEGLPSSDASLPKHGLGMTDDGRVFFNTADQLVLRDTNQNGDGYEWRDGISQLISTGTSVFDSGLLGVSADGRDAFFFTREKLVASDLNGEAMKLYDAREEGGFFEIPEQHPCAASDECHGPSSQAPGPTPVGTLKGSGGQIKAKPKCKKGFVRKHRKCVKKHARRKGHHKKHGRTAKKSRGAQR
jgi:hypothetical protein